MRNEPGDTMHVEFELPLEIGHRLLHLHIEAMARETSELYGADADGNRGMMMTGLDLETLEFWAYDSRGKDLTAKIKARRPKEYQSLERMVWQYLEDEY